MRLFARVLTLSAVAVFATGCDKNQPARLDQVTAALEYRVEGVVSDANVYPSVLADTNGDGQPDTVIPARETFLGPRCEALPGTSRPGPVPWPFALELTVVRSGTTDPVVLDTTSTGTGSFTFERLTFYEESTGSIPDFPLDPPVDLGGGRTAYAYTDGSLGTTGSRVYLVNCASVGESSLTPYENNIIEAQRGDLIRFQARRAFAGLGPGSAIDFRTTLLVNGVPVEVDGTSVVDDPETGLAFTYLVN